MEKIAESSCECISGLKLSDDVKTKNKQLGACLLKFAVPYKDRLKKDFGIDITSSKYKDSYMLGQKVAAKMMQFCPELLVTVNSIQSKKENTTAITAKSINTGAITGQILEVVKNQFYSIRLKTQEQNLLLLWLHPFKNSQELIDHSEEYIGKQCLVEFREEELFDPKLQQYRNFKVITSLNLFENE